MSQYYIYKIVCDDLPDYVYVGSTKVFRARKSRHKQSCNNPNNKRHNLKVYKTIRENGGWDNWRMVLVEECGDITLIQARIREEHHRLQLNANMNSKKAFRSEDERREYTKEKNKKYYEVNKELMIEKSKHYYEENKDKKREYDKRYREENKERIKEKQKKQYYAANKDELKEQKKQYYQANKERIKEKQKEKVTCECGCVVNKGILSRHKKTTKHTSLLA